MIPFDKDQYNKLCAEFLGGEIFEEGDRWKTRNWNNPNYRPFKVISSCPLTMWGTKEETYNRVLADVLASYGAWGCFDSDWNWIMEVVDKIEKTYAWVSIKGCLVTTVEIDVNAPTKKEAVVKAIWEFLNWHKKYKK